MSSRVFDPAKEGYIRTLNKTGYTTKEWDIMGQACIDFARGKSLPVLDIGCAFGLITFPLLAQGNYVIANDLDQGHLDKLLSETRPSQRSRLTLRCGSFPEEIGLSADSLSCAIASWVFHFFSPKALERSAHYLFDVIEPDGKVFISANSPYVKLIARFIPVYEERKRSGEPFPGWMEDVSAYLMPAQSENLPKSMHFLDPDVLRRLFESAGFVVEYADFFHRKDCTEGLYWDGRENVGLIARKPKK